MAAMAPSLMLILLVASIEATIESAREEPKQLKTSSFSSGTDIVLVSLEKQWKEAHTLFARRIGRKLTTWRLPDNELRAYVLRNIIRGRNFVLIGADPSMSHEDMQKLTVAAGVSDLCVSWLFVRPQSEILSQTVSSWQPALACQAIGLLDPNVTVVRNTLWPVTSAAVPNVQSSRLLEDADTRLPEPKRLSGQKLIVTCPVFTSGGHNKSYCDDPSALHIFQLLEGNGNLSMDYRNVSSLHERTSGMFSIEWDMIYFIGELGEADVIFFDIPNIFLHHETFFSRKSTHRTVTLSEVGRESWRIVAVTLTLIGLVTVTQTFLTEGVRHSVHSAASTVSVLVAAVLATSTPEPDPAARRGSFFRRALFGLWFMFILPLSFYFRSELTSIVTLKRPAERIDTLGELEDALDRGEVAPCALVNTGSHAELMADESDWPQVSLMRKLRAAFKLHDPGHLITNDYRDCLACALRHDRVCYTLLEQPCYMREAVPDVREFRQHFRMTLSGIRVRKSLPFYGRLRRFFLATQEGHLIKLADGECSYEDADATFQFDLKSLFKLQAMLLGTTIVVLGVELLIAWCSHFNSRLLHA